jgi:hypothetical protein
VTRGAAAVPLDFETEVGAGEVAVVLARHPSGALTFHASVERIGPRGPRRRGGGGAVGVGAGRVRFVINPRPVLEEDEAEGAAGPVRRGLVSQAIKFAVVKLKEAVIDRAVSTASRLLIKGLERGWWAARGMEEGWHRVTTSALRAGRLPAVEPADLRGTGRALLLVHGTFSHAASAFRGLADGDFFARARELYGERIFAFNHFTLSKSPEENVAELLRALPAGGLDFDVVTHSRGGLVLRHVIERAELFGGNAARFRLGHAVLVAAPNGGTPWVTPGRWEDTLGLVGNLLEALPIDNPWTDGAAFVANGLTWLAGHVAGDWPGLASMDARGESIAQLQRPPGPAASAYSVLAANAHPSGNLLARMVDAGVDGFFAGANDLVVPSEGGWRIDVGHGLAVPPERVGCFGPGGNLTAGSGALVQHLNFFAQRETADFLWQALRREPQSLGAIDLERALPIRRLFRGAAALKTGNGAPALTVAGARERALAATASATLATAGRAGAERAGAIDTPAGPALCGDEFHLLILHGSQGRRETQILATYRNARVLEPFATRNFSEMSAELAEAKAGAEKAKVKGGPSGPGAALSADAQAGTRFQKIIALDRRIHQCMAGDQSAKMPEQAELEELGRLLFEALFSGNVRRLYDVARSEQRSGLLSVILTCTVPWLAALPWEFALDPSRRKFLATEEIYFIRNVVTAVPAQHGPARRRLRLLVVAASPDDTPDLSEEEEAEKIRRGFKTLIDAGLADVDVLTDATPAALHERTETRRYDVVHFIGHGDFDREAHKGVLLFETADGGQHRAENRTLREILCGRGVQLIFLNACESGRDDYESRNRGVAQALMEGGVPAVVANQYPVLDSSAVAFAEHFYWSLAHGATLGAAARESRIAVNYSREGEMIDWAVPVLLARDPDFRLCEPCQQPLIQGGRRRARARLAPPPRPPLPPLPPPEETTAKRGRTGAGKSKSAKTAKAAKVSRMAVALANAAAALPQRHRVALADLPHGFPELVETLNRLNLAQGAFEFSAVDVTVPLCAWSLQPGKNKLNRTKESYLYADRFAEQLAAKPRELGVEFLACITDRPMVRDTPEGPLYNIHLWWPEVSGPAKDQAPLLLFSTFGQPIPPRGPVAERVLANGLVASLAGILMGGETHRGGPEDCPLYFNPHRDFSYLAGVLRFHDACRRRLEKKFPRELEAFDRMLTVFQPGAVSLA